SNGRGWRPAHPFRTAGHTVGCTPWHTYMSVTGLDVFDRTVHTTNRWLQELTGLLDGGSRHDAYVTLRATLHALRDRLPIEETAELAAQLPMLVRGFYYEGWDPTGKPVRERSLEGF